MLSNPNSSYNPTSTSIDRSLRFFLIPPREQRQFLILFTLMTAIGLVVGNFTADLLMLKSPIFDAAAKFGIWQRFLSNLVLGAIIGIAQWSILRKYIPSWLWIVATSVGWGISAVIARTWSAQIGGALNGIFYLCLGVTQWLLLRRYVVNARWWLLIVPFSVYVFRLITAIVFFTIIQTNLRGLWQISSSTQILIQSIFASVPLGLIQAISLCIFSKKSSKSAASFISQLESPLFSAREITDNSQIKALSSRLYEKIERAWSKKITLTQDLVYIVAIASDGSIIFYHPVNLPAINQINLTPLPELVESQYNGGANQPPVVRFRVVFSPKDGIKIRY